MSKPIHRPRNNRFLRRMLTGLMAAVAAILVFEVIWWADYWEQGGHYMYAFETFYGGLEIFSPVMEDSPTIGWFRTMFILLFPVLFTVWLYRSLRNLNAMGIYTQLHPRWVALSWLIPPLIIFTFYFALHEVITRYYLVQSLFAKEQVGTAKPKRALHRLANSWWLLFWVCRVSLWFRIVLHFWGLGPASELFDPEYLVIVALSYVGPLFLGMVLINRIGQVEDEVLGRWDEGTIIHWRSQKLQPGRINADHRELPTWYDVSETAEANPFDRGWFRDQPSSSPPQPDPS